MKQTARTTRSATHLQRRSKRMEILIKIEEDTKVTASPAQDKANTASSLEPIVKVEETDAKLRNGPQKQADSRLYCKACEKLYVPRSNYTRHLQTLLHEDRVTRKTLPPGTLPNELDPDGYCKLCNKSYETTINYRRHLKNFHKMKLTPLHPVPDFSITPNINDASNNCDSCSYMFKSRLCFRRHLERIHKMILPKRQRITPNPNISPNIYDPNYYCTSCQFTYKTHIIFRQHLQIVHKMELTSLKKTTLFDPTISVSDTNNPNNASCAICKTKYSDKYTYQKHLKKFHKDGNNAPVIRRKVVCNPDIQPDPNDPNIYCASCQRQLKSKVCFRRHIRKFHPEVKLDKITRPQKISPFMAEMDAGNPNNTICTICDKNYSSRYNFRSHIVTVHMDGKRAPMITRKKSFKSEFGSKHDKGGGSPTTS